MTDYLLDSNVFIEAKNRYYGFDFCPAFWDWLTQQKDTGKVASIEKVAGELKAKDDELARWAAAQGDSFFVRPDDAVVRALGTVSTWAENQNYRTGAVATFFASCRLLACCPRAGSQMHRCHSRDFRKQ